MRLHGFSRSSASYRVRIALNLKGLDYDNQSYRLRAGEQRSEAYLRLNPQGLVPALETEAGVFTQSLAIIDYLDEVYPAPPLLPPTKADRAYCRSLAQIVACDIHPIDNLRVLGYLQTSAGLDEAAVAAWYNHWIAEGFTALEAMLASDPRTGRYCIGDTPGLADIALVPQVFNAERFQLDMTPYPTIARINAACLALPAVADAHPSRQADAQ